MIEYLQSLFPHRVRDERGASAVEYGLLVAGIAAVIVAVVFLLGGTVKTSFTDTCKSVNNGAECKAPAAPASTP